MGGEYYLILIPDKPTDKSGISKERKHMTRNCFRKIYSVLPSPLEKLCLKFENAIIYIFYGVLTTVLNYIAHFGLRLAFTDFSQVDEYSFSSVMQAMENSAVSSAGAATFAWIIALIFAFFVNKFFVFESKSTNAGSLAKEFTAFAGGRIFSYGCEVLIMFVFVDQLHLNELIIKLVCNVIVMILNYLFSKFLVFRKKKA